VADPAVAGGTACGGDVTDASGAAGGVSTGREGGCAGGTERWDAGAVVAAVGVVVSDGGDGVRVVRGSYRMDGAGDVVDVFIGVPAF
jgi:hypothetical protein